MPVFTQLKAILAGVTILVVLIIVGLIYWRGSSNATTKADLRVAREVIKTERETKKVEVITDQRVNAEGIQTATTAQEATREIEAIRKAASVVGVGKRTALYDVRSSPSPATPGLGADCDSACARVMQLAREARAAAVASSAKLQPARTGTR